jgi:hypothetical protein
LRRHRVRFAICRSMWAIAVLAVLLGATRETQRLLRRRHHFLELAEAHASRAYDYGEGRNGMCFKDEFYQGDHLKVDYLRHLDQIRDLATALERKYRYAASYPWLEVEADPPWPPYP